MQKSIINMMKKKEEEERNGMMEEQLMPEGDQEIEEGEFGFASATDE